jgi:hypothetical protein
MSNKMSTKTLAAISALSFSGGIGLAIYTAHREGYLYFIKTAHIASLFILLVSYTLSWFAMTWMTNPQKLEIRPKQWVAFGFTILLAVFWWGRYVFTVADTAETTPVNGTN